MARSEPRAQRPDMAAYGVPDDNDGLLEWSWAAERLAANRNFWLTTVDPAGRPHSMPLWGWWDDDADTGQQSFWFSCADTSLKARNLATNPAVVVATDDTIEVISIEGDAEPMASDDPATVRAGRAWAQRYAEAMDVDLTSHDAEQELVEAASFFCNGAAFRVSPRKALAIIERPEEFGPRATRFVW